MHIAELWRYPVKSMAGEKLESVELGTLGIPGDRELVVIEENGRIVDARIRPLLLLLHPTLNADGRVSIDGLDWESAEVARRVEDAAGPGARLVRHEGAVRFDVMPLLVISDGAIAALGVDYRRLRPNLVFGGVEGLAERGWEGKFLGAGSAVIGLSRLRGRCVMTTFDPDTGAQDVEVLKMIRREFDGKFALNAWVARAGRIALGDPVTLLDGFEDAEAPPLGRYATRQMPDSTATGT